MSDERKQQLIDVLATGNEKAMVRLLESWGIEPAVIYPENGARPYYNLLENITLLAQAAKVEPPAAPAQADPTRGDA